MQSRGLIPHRAATSPSGLATSRVLVLGVIAALALVDPRPVSAATGDIQTIVGGPGIGDALLVLQNPSGVAISDTTIFLSEQNRGIVRAVDRATGHETVYAGRPDEPCADDPAADDGSPASGIRLCGPSGLALDPAGNLLVSDSGHNRVRRIDATTGILTTVAGGVGTSGGDGGAATAAGLCVPRGLAVDPAGNLFIADACEHRIRRVDATTGVIATIAGDGVNGFAGDGGPATAARLNGPRDVSVDAAGSVFIADLGNNRVRRVDGASGVISTIAGTGAAASTGTGGPATAASLRTPFAVFVDDQSFGDVYIAESLANKVRRVRASDGIIDAFAGTGTAGFSGDGGAAASAQLTAPVDIAVDDDGAFVATANRVRRVDFAASTISTVAGKPDFDDVLDGVAATHTQLDLDFPGDVAFDAAGNLFFTDTYNVRIRRVDATTGIVTTVAGNGSQGYNGELVPAADVWIFLPTAVAVDAAGNVYYTDESRVRVIDATTGLVRTVAGTGVCEFSGDGGPAVSAEVCYPADLLVEPSGDLLVADSENRRVRRIDMATGEISTIAGNGGGTSSGDGGPALAAAIGVPSGLALDAAGNIHVSNGTDRIRRIAALDGTISTVAGGGASGAEGVPATTAQIDTPLGLAIDRAGDLLLAEIDANRIRRVSTATGLIETVAGDGEERFSGDGGPAALASLQRPASVAIDSTGAVVIYDSLNQRIRRIEPAPCGNGTLDAGEQCDLGPGNGSPSSCCTATCQLRASAAVCRPAAGPCDVAEACTGAGAACPSDVVQPDGDGDGACDAIDECTNVGGGRDLVVKPSLAFSRINGPPIPDDDRLVLSGEFDLPAGTSFADLDPALSGARLVVRSRTGVKRIDVTLAAGTPGGAGTRGWTQRPTSWTFVDATASPANGIAYVRLNDRSRRAPGRVGLRVVGRRGGYPIAPGDEPLAVAFVVGDQAASIAGRCTEVEFSGGECRFSARTDRLRCRR